MTTVAVLGGTGMLGHKLSQLWAERFDCWATVRGDALSDASAAVLDPSRTLTGVTADDPDSVGRALDRCGAEVVVNCVGVVKQALAPGDEADAIRVNALFPHELAVRCQSRGVRVLQVSTDCVFAGDRGAYREDSIPDARDIYGRSKLLGELEGEGRVTVRTSIVGRELEHGHGLVEWLEAQEGRAVPGFTRAVFSGLTTAGLADELGEVIERRPEMTGVWHVGGEPIAKHDLLVLLRDALALDVEVVPDDSMQVDRSLNSERYRRATGRTPPTWPDMVRALAEDPTPYHRIRRQPVAQR